MPNMALLFKQTPKVTPIIKLLKKVIKYDRQKPKGIIPKNQRTKKYQ